MIYLIIVSLLVIYVARFYWKVSKYPKGPFPLPLIGNLHQIDSQQMHLDIARFKKQYGDMVTVWFTSRPVVFLNSYDIIKEALSTKGDKFVDRPNDNMTKVNMSVQNGGIIFSNGESWRDVRRISLQILRDFGMGKNIMEHMIQEQVDAVIKYIDRDVDKNAADFGPIILNMVANIINQLLYGYSYPYGKSEDLLQFNENVDKIIFKRTETIWPRVSDAFPFIISLPYIGRKAFTELKEITNDNLRMTNINVNKVLENYSTEDEPTCYVQAYCQQMAKSPYLTKENLYNICNDFFFAGTETTTTLIRWIVTYLTIYPDIQEKIRREIASVVGFDRLPSLNDKAKMPYVQAVIYEIQRHSNMFPMQLERVAIQDVTLSGHTFPKNGYEQKRRIHSLSTAESPSN